MNEDEKKKKEENIEKDQNESREDLEILKEKLAAAEKEVQENLAGWQRAKADFINYKKDQEKYLEEFRKYANQDLIISLLPTVDSFDLAVKHLPEDLKSSDWAKGVLCIKSMFENFLRDAGVIEIKTFGEKFDPHTAEAVAEEESDQEEGTVVEEVQKGYKIGEKVIRPAKVKIAKRK